MWGGVGRCGEVWGGVGRCGEVWGGVGRCGEVSPLLFIEKNIILYLLENVRVGRFWCKCCGYRSIFKK